MSHHSPSEVTLVASPEPKAVLSRHPVHYYSDGTFIFIVENYIFRIYQDLLGRRSEVFRDLFDIPQADVPILGEKGLPPLPGDGQMFIDGVPAVFLDDKADDFSNLLDIVMPGLIRKPPKQTFDRLAGIYCLCDKYLIEDIREWALSWLNDILPHQEDDIHKIASAYKDPVVAARVVDFAQGVDLPQFLPMAYYALATYPWDRNPKKFNEVGQLLSASDQYRIESGRAGIHREVLNRVFTLPDFGLAGRTTCSGKTHHDKPCDKARQKAWADPSVTVATILEAPLEELERRVKHPPRTFCSKCTSDSVSLSSLFRHALYEKLPALFLLTE